ncbi:MAG TPA: hypothetical protein PLV13_10950 [Ilumatobacteraceae bacterium]|nr:hypothetical protein [Ilumatobacteraceae bacterium]
MQRVAVRLAAFVLVLAAVFGGGYALGAATGGDDAPAPMHDNMTDHKVQP